MHRNGKSDETTRLVTLLGTDNNLVPVFIEHDLAGRMWREGRLND